MLKLSVRNLLDHKIRFALTTFAVVLGVSFVVGSFVLTDGLRATFNNLVEDVNQDVDAQVRARTEFDESDFTATLIDESLLDVVAAVDEVAEAVPSAGSASIIPVKADGEAVETLGPPILGVNWSDGTTNPLTVIEGSPPTGPSEFVMDVDSANNDNFMVGETYDVIGVEGAEPFELVGITRFGDDNTLAGAVLMAFELDELQRLSDSEGLLETIEVVGEAGLSNDELLASLNAVLPTEAEAVSGAVVTEEGQDDFGAVVDLFGNALLGFAFVALFVSAFIINNTFNIVLGSRVRELALLRAIGASGRQVRISTLLEALVVGVLASLVGLGIGVLLAIGLRVVLDAIGLGLPSIEITIAGRTIIVAFLVGVGVTMLSAISPARKASTVPPIAALQAGFVLGSGEGTKRTIIGATALGLGVFGLAWGLFASPDSTPLLLVLLGGGAVLVFVGVAMLSPLFSSPTARFLGTPLRWLPWLGVAGELAQENSARNNKRTATTASALMIGLALVAMATVVAQSLKESFTNTIQTSAEADYFVSTANFGGFSPLLAEGLEEQPEFSAVSATRFGKARVRGGTKDVVGADLTQLTDVLDIGVIEGDAADGADGASILLHEDSAADAGVSAGDTIVVEFAAGGVQELRVAAIYENAFLVGNYLIDLTTWDEYYTISDDFFVLARVADEVSQAEVDAVLEPVAAAFPQLEIETKDEFLSSQEAQLDSILIVINVLLALAIVIALLGITNTLALSVFERTREIGLLRAVGMTRRQTRSMVRWEAAVVSAFGAILGTFVGIGFGWAAVAAMPEDIIDRLAIPMVTLILYIALASVAGLIAASLPARRAARLNVLDAIAHE